MASGDDTAKSLEFTDLPLIEVALKRIPRSHFPVSLAFILELRKVLPEHFDQILDLEQIEQPPGAKSSAYYAIPSTGGCRIVDSSKGISVSVQPDMLVIRWESTAGPAYPRYPAMRQAADEVLVAIENVGGQRFEPALINMAYANRVGAVTAEGRTQPGPWPLSENWTPVGITNEAQALETQSVFRGADGIDRRVTVQFRDGVSEAPPWYLLLTIAGKAVEEGELPTEVETQVHNALIEWFPRLLSEEARGAYGLCP